MRLRLLGIAGLLLAHAAAGQTWNGRSGGNWTSAGNWIGGLPANNGTADLVFSAATSTGGVSTLNLDWDVHSILWNADALNGGQVRLQQQDGFSRKTLTIREGLTNASGGEVRIDADVMLAGDQIWNSGNYLAVTGMLSGSGTLRKIGDGVLYLDDWGESAPARTGATIIDAGTLEVASGNSTSLGTGALTINNAILKVSSYTLMQRVTVNGAATVIGSGRTEISGGIDGGGSLMLRGPSPTNRGNFFLTGVSSYEGGTFINDAQVTVLGAQRSLGLGDATVRENGTLTLQAESNLAAGTRVLLEGGTLLLAEQAINPANVISTASTSGVLGLAEGKVSSVVNMATFGNGKLFLGANGAVTYTADALLPGVDNVHRLGGAGTLTITGRDNLLTGTSSVIVGHDKPGFYWQPDIVVLERANDYSGGTTLHNVSLFVGNDHALGSGPITLKGGRLASLSGSGPRVIANDVLFQSGDQLVSFGGVEELTFTGAFNLGGLRNSVSGDPVGAPVTIASSITNGTLNFENGLFRLTGTNNAVFEISGGAWVEVDRPANLHGAGEIKIAKGRLRTMASMTLSRDIFVGPKSGTSLAAVETPDHVVLTLTGDIRGATLDKIGAGTLILEGGSFSGVQARAGVVEITGGAGGGRVTATESGIVRGSGNLTSLWMYPGTRLSPGGSGLGELVIDGGSTFLAARSYLDFDLSATGSDRITINGIFTTDAPRPAILNIQALDALAPGQTFVLLDWTNGDPRGVTMESFALGETTIDGWLSIEDRTLRFTVVPEPRAVALLLLGGGVVFLRGRLRPARGH